MGRVAARVRVALMWITTPMGRVFYPRRLLNPLPWPLGHLVARPQSYYSCESVILSLSLSRLRGVSTTPPSTRPLSLLETSLLAPSPHQLASSLCAAGAAAAAWMLLMRC